MTLKTDIIADLDVFYNADEFAEEITHISLAGASTSAKAIFTAGEGDGYKGADKFDHNAVMRVRVSEIAAINSGEQITRGTETWEITDGEKSADGLEWIVGVSRLTR